MVAQANHFEASSEPKSVTSPHTQPVEQENNRPLSPAERALLGDCEAAIQKHLTAFFEVGIALLKIRDGRLYRAEFKTFDEYCRTRWGISRIHAYRLLNASEVVQKTLSPMGNIPLPENERQVRPLAGLPAAIAQKAWETAVRNSGNKKVTFAAVALAAKQSLASANNPKPAPVELWQTLVEPLLKEALKNARLGNREATHELLYKALLRVEVGKSTSVKEL